ncbi:MAG TPA: BamA/TamA family outer membrane protein, partial [Thermodesulfobacteriota bacterium]|nr:BamA/TamA family outer membrane protein [Thermodesulfobacteriota bacterium]
DLAPVAPPPAPPATGPAHETHETTIRVRAGLPPEPPPGGLLPAVPAREALPVRVRFRGGGERWLAAESVVDRSWTLRSVRPVASVEADPDRVTEDRWRADNRVPAPWRFLLTQFSASVELRRGEVELEAAGSLSRRYGPGAVLGAAVFRDQESAGTSLSLGYGAPRASGGRHGVGLTGTFERLDPGFGPSVGPERQIVTLALGYGLDTRTDSRHPLSGSTAGIGLTWSDDAIGSDADYLLGSARATTYLRVAPGRALALRGEAGETLAGTAPFGKGFLLGGAEGLRAFPKDAFSGRSYSLGSVEYRFPLVRDVDRAVVGLVTAHGLSGVVGVEAGQTSADRNPFRPGRYRVGLNVGLRLSVRLLGVSPVLWAFDAAVPIDRRRELDAVQLYLSASHTF